MRVEARVPADCRWYLRPFFWNRRRKHGVFREKAEALQAWRQTNLFAGWEPVALEYGEAGVYASVVRGRS